MRYWIKSEDSVDYLYVTGKADAVRRLPSGVEEVGILEANAIAYGISTAPIMYLEQRAAASGGFVVVRSVTVTAEATQHGRPHAYYAVETADFPQYEIRAFATVEDRDRWVKEVGFRRRAVDGAEAARILGDNIFHGVSQFRCPWVAFVSIVADRF